MMKRIFSLLGVALICGAVNLSSQIANAADESGAPDYRPFTLGLEAGSTGFGPSVNWRFADHFGARAGIHYFRYSRDGDEIEGVTYNSELRMMSEPLGVDIYPWAKSSFRITVGILLNQNELTANVPAAAPGVFVPITIGANSYDTATIGGLNLLIEQLAVSPYISIGGNIYLGKARRWSLGGEIGVAYTGSPDVTLSSGNFVSTQLQQDLAAEEQELEDAAEKLKFYPIIKISLNYSF